MVKKNLLGEEKIVYSLGHSNRDIADIIRILKKFNILNLVDVRRFPTSRKYPWFNKENFMKTITENGIRYFWLGDLLGGYREGGYLKYMETNDFKIGIKKLISIIKSGKTAILCSEKFWFRCHRRFISDVLKGLGFNVIHIIDEDRTYIHKRSVKIDI